MRNNRITRWLAGKVGPRCAQVVRRREPDFVIGGRDDPYLLRWWLVPRNPLLNVYLHVFLRDDDDRALHDHPWPSVSLSIGSTLPLVLGAWGPGCGLREIYKDWRGVTQSREVPFGSLVWRGPRFAHRLQVPKPGTMTIFMTGPRVRAWGFHCPQGWRHWKDFTGYRVDGDSATIGKGCE